jgi:hypothetical protein
VGVGKNHVSQTGHARSMSRLAGRATSAHLHGADDSRFLIRAAEPDGGPGSRGFFAQRRWSSHMSDLTRAVLGGLTFIGLASIAFAGLLIVFS